MKNKFLIFDIDGTLCDINKPVNRSLAKVLYEISKKNKIVLASGKPFGYIAGFVRQLGLDDCIVIGENGATIMYSATFPPVDYYKIEISKDIKSIFEKIKSEFEIEFQNTIWFQPNDVNLTVFPIDINIIDKIHQFAKQFENSKINTYYHKDSIDFTPKGFDKGTAVDVLLDKFKINRDDLYIFGEGSNDLPMLKKSNNSILVNSNIKDFEPKLRLKDYNELKKNLLTNF